MTRYWFPKAYADFAQRLRAPSGFVLAAAFAYWAAPSVKSMAYGILVSLLGLALRAWAAGHLAKNQNLATSGPYGHTRNPLYIGTLLVAAGLAVTSRQPALAVLFAVAFALVYLPAIELEEQHLRKLFAEYADYARSVSRLGFRLSPRGGRESFQFALYMKNEEYKAALGFLFAVALLVYKVMLEK